MNIENEDNHFTIIGKYLSGEASPEEAMMLHAWMEEPNNKQEYDRIISLWNHLPLSAERNEINTLQRWRELQKVLPPEAKTMNKRKPVYWYLAAASIVAVLITTSVVLFNRITEKESPETAPSLVTKVAKEEVVAETLPDKSSVTINRNSHIAYATTFNTSERNITLNGEGFFDVAHDKAKPFTITVNDVKIRVVGTSFNVKESMNPREVQVQVQSGIVKMYTSDKELIVNNGQTGIYRTLNKQFLLKNTVDINSISYATKTFSFHDVSLAEASRFLENAFNVRMEFDRAKFKDCRITAEFAAKPLSYILDVISATLNTSYLQKDKTIYIKGQGCL